MKKYVLPLMAVVTVLSMLVAVMSYLRWAPSRPLVTVGNQVISKNDYQFALDKQSGKSVLTTLVFTTLVRQAATRAGIMPTDKDVDDRIASLAKRNPQINTEAQDPNMGPDFRRNMLTDLALENLRMKDLSASEDEISTFYARHKALYTLPRQVQTTTVVSQYPADSAIAQRLLQQNVKPDVIARQPRLNVVGISGFNINVTSLPLPVRTEISKEVLAMQAGQIKTIPVSSGQTPAAKYFLTFKVNSTREAQTLPLSQVHDDVARQVKLLKADPPQKIIAALYQATPPVFAIPRYSAFFDDVQQYNAHNK